MKSGVSEVIEILMRRDGDTREEARHRVKNVQERMADCDYDYAEVENILLEDLGLEIDYAIGLLP